MGIKLNLKISGSQRHGDAATAVSWSSTDQLFSVGDDGKVKVWSETLDECTDLLSIDAFFPTALSFCASAKRNADVFAVGSDDGHFRIVSSSGRVEKKVAAHQGAVTAVRWSTDGSSILTAGEDGNIKIWSKTGMLRSVLVSTGSVVYTACWAGQGQHVIYPLDRTLCVKPLQPSGKVMQWKAHDGVILGVDCNPHSGHIVSVGEDCKYKVWDMTGKLLYSSATHDHPLLTVRWSYDSSLFAVGGYDTLRVCDAAGWSYLLEKPSCGSIYDISWTRDGAALGCACADGQVITATVAGRSVSDGVYEVHQNNKDVLTVRNIMTNTTDVIELRDRLVTMSLKFEKLVVMTTNQCLLFSNNNWSSPATVDMRSGVIAHLVVQAEDTVLVVDQAGAISVYNYDGRLLSAPKLSSAVPELFTERTVSLNNHTLAVRDHKDEKAVRIYDVQSGKELAKPLQHHVAVISVRMDNTNDAMHTHLALLDVNRDLYLVQARRSVPHLQKLATMVHSCIWQQHVPMLAALLDDRLSVWYHPSAVFLDQDLLPLTRSDSETSSLGQHALLQSFTGNFVTLRRADGASVVINVAPHPVLLHRAAAAKQWSSAIRLARMVKDNSTWACLASLATQAKDLETAEIAYAAITAVDKVEQIKYIKTLPTPEGRNAEMALMCSQTKEAESILLQAGLIYRVIEMNCTLCRWDRALELAVKHKTHVDTVLGLRQRYLQSLSQAESKPKFLEFNASVDVNWDDIDAKIAAEWETERGRPGATPYA